jgi:hypothetical protein
LKNKEKQAMDDLQSAKIGLQNHKKISDPKAAEFWREIGALTTEMRKKRHKSQEEFKIPVRTVRRIEKGDEPHIGVLAYAREIKPCIKEMAKVIRLLADSLEPECLKCDPDCQMYGKTYKDFADTVRQVVGLLPRT